MEKFGIPAELKFNAKIEPGWKLIQRAHARGTTYLSGAKIIMLYHNARKISLINLC